MRAVNAVHESIKQEGQLAIADEKRDDEKGDVFWLLHIVERGLSAAWTTRCI
jgi:hypothetical protein